MLRGSQLKRMRILKNMTQKEIAEKVGIARNTYTNIELGVKNPSLNVALKIKEVLSYFEVLNYPIPLAMLIQHEKTYILSLPIFSRLSTVLS